MERVLASLMVIMLLSPSSYASKGEEPSPTCPQQQAGGQVVYHVKDAKEFLDAIGSNRRIILAPGDYDLSVAAKERGAGFFGAVAIAQVHDGFEVIIHDASNVTIEGTEEAGVRTRLLASARFGNALSFHRVTNVSISNLVAEHSPGGEESWGSSLFRFKESSDVRLDNLDLARSSGCGLSLYNVTSLSMSNSLIHDGLFGILSIAYSSYIEISNSQFFNNRGVEMFRIVESNDVAFNAVTIEGNSDGPKFVCNGDDWDSFLFFASGTSRVEVKHPTIRANDSCHCVTYKGALTFTDIEGTWRDDGTGDGFKCPYLNVMSLWDRARGQDFPSR